MPQHAGFEIVRAAKGIDQIPVVVACNGIDGEIAALEILLERNVRCRVDGEAGVAWAGFTLGAGERVFLVRLRMEKDREVLTHRAIPELQHFLRAAAHDDVIVVLDRQTQQLIADRAADSKDLHGS